MSIPLHDCGKLYLSEGTHSYLRAEAESERLDLVALCRDILTAHVEKRLHVISVAQDNHSAKGLGKIDKDSL